jgi:hypothetical protein
VFLERDSRHYGRRDGPFEAKVPARAGAWKERASVSGNHFRWAGLARWATLEICVSISGFLVPAVALIDLGIGFANH